MEPSRRSSRSRHATERLRALQQEIMTLLLDRNLRPGEAIPTEHELMSELDVGRNTLREALKVLQSMGILEVRHGYGTFVAHKNLDALAMGLEFHAKMSLLATGDDALEVVEVRQALESSLIGAAMDKMSEQDLENLEECVRGMEHNAREGRMNPEPDHEFHRLLFAPLNNELLTNLLQVFWSVYGRIRRQLEYDPPAAQQNAQIHRRILEAVRAGHKPEAADLIRRHFDGLRLALSQNLPGSAP